ncbi:MAG: hypothetical protein EXR71_15700 [Myxococcales bacterium]|nr:hypothetical protein [Myxococcales bacterium]
MALWLVPGVLAAAGVGAAVGFVWLRSVAGNDWLLAEVLRRIQPAAGVIEIGQLRTDLLHRVELAEVRLLAPDGSALITAERVVADLESPALIGRVLQISRLKVTGLVVDLPEPSVFATMWPADPAAPARPWRGLPVDIVIDAAHLEGAVTLPGVGLDAVVLDLELRVRGSQVSWSNLALTAGTVAGPLTVASSGTWSSARSVVGPTTVSLGTEHQSRVVLGGALDGERLAFELAELRLDKPGLVPVFPALASLPISVPLAASGSVRGTVGGPEVTLLVTTAGGVVAATGAAVLADRAWRATVETAGLDVDAVVDGLEPLRVAGRIEASGVGWSWPDDVQAAADVDVVVLAGGERIVARGPVRVDGGHLAFDRVAADLGWARGRLSGDADLPRRSATVEVERSTVELSRFGLAGTADFAGAAGVTWGDVVTVDLRGDAALAGLAVGGASMVAATGPVVIAWDGERATGTVDLELAGLAYAGRSAATGSVHADLGAAVGFSVRLAEPDRDVAVVEGRVELATRELWLQRVELEVAPARVVTGNGEQRVRLVEGGVADAHLDLSMGASRFTASGGVAMEGHDTVVLSAEHVDLADLEALVGSGFQGWRGVATGRLGLVGNLRSPALDGLIEVEGLTIPDAVADAAATLAVEGDGTRLRFEGGVGSAAVTRLAFAGAVPLVIGVDGVRLAEAGPVQVQLTVPPVDTADLVPLLHGRALPEARLSAELALSGTMKDPILKLTASADVPLGAGGPTVRAWLDSALSGGVATARVVVNQGFVARLETTLASRVDTAALAAWLGGNGPRPEASTVLSDFGGAVVLKQLPIATVRHFVNLKADVDGALAGAFALDGSPFAPRVQGGVNLIGAQMGALRVTPATLEIRPLGIGYFVHARLGFAAAARAFQRAGLFAEAAEPELPTCAGAPGDAAGGLDIKGVVPLPDRLDFSDRGLSLEISGPGIPLAAVEAFVPGMAESGGCFALGGQVSGTLVDPRLDLGVSLTRGATTLSQLGVRMEDIAVSGRFQGEQLIIDYARAKTRAGSLRFDSGAGGFDATGVLKLKEWLPTELAATVKLDRAWLVATADRRVQATGDLQVRGKDRVIDLEGKLRVDAGYVRLAERFFSETTTSRLHPDIELVRPGAQAEAAAEGEVAPASFTVRPKLELDLARRMRLRAALPLQGAYGDLARSLSTVVVETDVDGVVTVTQKEGRIRLLGELTTERGEATLLGRPFDLKNGSVAFTGTDIRQPILNLRAVHHTTDCGDIVASIGGVPGAPRIEFSTEGEGLSSDESVIQTLILGSCPNAADDTGQDALGQTLALVTQMLQKEVQDYGSGSGEAIHLETLEIDESGSGRIGIALGRNVFLTTEFDGAAETDENAFSVRVELALPYRWYLTFDSGDRGVSSVAARRKWRF